MIFGKDAQKCCQLCEFGFLDEEDFTVKCTKRKNKSFAPDHKCRKFVYDPLKKSPHRAPKLREHSPEEFTL